ncbi:hypothetical protein V473_20190 [Sphingobium cupriresistens LL01]|uniref:Uncharacterized protein n=1 Tax=Sphingobium cupriresistens LL01 TaxID=1420583 RepID=A0A0J7XP39_9SPHN|nr:hypothetical protein V473_20190 [Sphingobium cupriresistens LL01]
MLDSHFGFRHIGAAFEEKFLPMNMKQAMIWPTGAAIQQRSRPCLEMITSLATG